MKLKPIKTEHDYHQALERLEQIFDSKPGTKEGDELEILGILIENYENDFFPNKYNVFSKLSIFLSINLEKVSSSPIILSSTFVNEKSCPTRTSK